MERHLCSPDSAGRGGVTQLRHSRAAPPGAKHWPLWPGSLCVESHRVHSQAGGTVLGADHHQSPPGVCCCPHSPLPRREWNMEGATAGPGCEAGRPGFHPLGSPRAWAMMGPHLDFSAQLPAFCPAADLVFFFPLKAFTVQRGSCPYLPALPASLCTCQGDSLTRTHRYTHAHTGNSSPPRACAQPPPAALLPGQGQLAGPAGASAGREADGSQTFQTRRHTEESRFPGSLENQEDQATWAANHVTLPAWPSAQPPAHGTMLFLSV